MNYLSKLNPLMLLIVLLLFFSTDSCICDWNDKIIEDCECPFCPVTEYTLETRTQISLDISLEIKAAIKKLPVKIPLTGTAVGALSTDLKKIMKSVKKKPIDKVLAEIYNARVGKVCGIYKIWVKLLEGKSKERYDIMLRQAIDELYKGLDMYEKNELSLVDEIEITDPEENEILWNKIFNYSKDKMLNSKSEEDRKRWKKLYDLNTNVYVPDVLRHTKSNQLMKQLWETTQNIDTSQ
jgi:hypothetical protein